MPSIRRLMGGKKRTKSPNMLSNNGTNNSDSTGKGYDSSMGPNDDGHTPVRTLQQYHGGPNEERTEFMEKYSALANKSLAVAVEQVSIFLRSDNTVVSFFEQSADDIETPIVNRLSSRETVLRRSSDASMIVQAIIDAIIDLAIPVATAYQDAVDELELDVLTGKPGSNILEPCIRRTNPYTYKRAFDREHETALYPHKRSLAIPIQHLPYYQSRQCPPRPQERARCNTGNYASRRRSPVQTRFYRCQNFPIVAYVPGRCGGSLHAYCREH